MCCIREKNIDRTEKERNPLGPFQGFDGGDIVGFLVN